MTGTPVDLMGDALFEASPSAFEAAPSTPGSPIRFARLRAPHIIRALTTMALNVSLALFVSVSCLSLLRVFVDARLQTPIVIGLACGLAIPATARILRVPAWLAVLTSAAAEAIVLGVWFTEAAGTPLGPNTFADARESMWSAVEQVNRIVAPSPSLVGFGVAVGLVTWLVSLTADLMCFGIPTPIGALLPPGAVAIAAASLASRKDHRHESAWIFALVIALALNLIAAGLRDRARRARWFAHAPGSLIEAAVILGATFSVLGLVADQTAQRLAFDEKQPALDFRVGNQGGVTERVIASPLVSLQRRLLQQSDSEQFTVRSQTADGTDTPSYWRLTALDEFTGESWQSTGEYQNVGDSSRLSPVKGDPRTDIRQDYTIGSLGTESLPVAYAPIRYAGSLTGVSYAADTDTLLARSRIKNGSTYEIMSATPKNLHADDLSKYDSIVSGQDLNVNLPLSFPKRVRDLALELTKDQPTTVQKARALQDFFRTRFVYSLDVPAGSSEPALERFLFTDRTGYCEQFAGAFAAMARSIGIPTRVAVGFTPGRYDATDRRFHVTGKNAHAWPEVRLGDGSWFPFEPTPGRGFPGLQETTGVTPQDLSEAAQPATATTTAVPTTAVPTTTVASRIGRPTPFSQRRRSRWLAPAALLVLAALVIWFVRRRRGTLSLTGARPTIRVHRAPEAQRAPARRIDRAWAATERRVVAGTDVSETEASVAARMGGRHPELPELAQLTQRARYAETSAAQVSDDDAERAEHLAATIAGRTPTGDTPARTGSASRR